MDVAWSQVGQVLEAQRRVRFGQVGVRVSDVWYTRHIVPLLARDEQKGADDCRASPATHRRQRGDRAARAAREHRATHDDIHGPPTPDSSTRTDGAAAGALSGEPNVGADGAGERARGQRGASAGCAGRGHHRRSRRQQHHGRWGNADVSRPHRVTVRRNCCSRRNLSRSRRSRRRPGRRLVRRYPAASVTT